MLQIHDVNMCCIFLGGKVNVQAIITLAMFFS